MMVELKVDISSASVSLTHATNVSFLHFPAEIRNIVYAYALGGNTWSINMNGGYTKPHADNSVKHALALLRVNRQIYAEARLFPYQFNTFEGRYIGHLREWVQSLSVAQRDSITCVKNCQRGYLIQGAHGVDVSPIFWMDTPNLTQWELPGLKRIDIEVRLHSFSWLIDHEEAEAAKLAVMSKLRVLVAQQHPGVIVSIVLRRGF